MAIVRRFIVRGRVQGVGFRYAAAQKAKENNLAGWVRNLPAGEVETVVQGAQQALEDFENWLWQGPEYSRVTAVESKTPPEQSFERFRIERC
jgi:acylphosphatase